MLLLLCFCFSCELMGGAQVMPADLARQNRYPLRRKPLLSGLISNNGAFFRKKYTWCKNTFLGGAEQASREGVREQTLPTKISLEQQEGW
ncbi:hypothetical protein AEQ67_18405 [Pseudomonas sp. RIT-PI-q]|uniref:hypothetical protein n=1 Tax=Pseudomonas sp. RIT-PI-q TaxID=1690247 RepID=UPI0006CC2414|nr:hypothetical protein [Pseudomonas sp. RIT-PI-q]KPG95921.1 hypothetical protein AEQ67_18405 [Pseudomonas sp. RIT-PI-q]